MSLHGEYTLAFRLLGYKEVEHTGVVVKDGEATMVNTKLEETALSLGQEVVIVGEKPMMDPAETQSTTYDLCPRYKSFGGAGR